MPLATRIAAFAEFARHPRQQPTNLAFFNGGMYGLSLNAMMLLIPLHAIDLGFRLSDQGIIIAAPAAFMVFARLPGVNERRACFSDHGADRLDRLRRDRVALDEWRGLACGAHRRRGPFRDSPRLRGHGD